MIESIKHILHTILHPDLEWIFATYGVWIYALLFLIIFAETGLVVTPFLPGDSLLFAVGAMVAMGHLSMWVLIPLLVFAAILGDAVNYSIGKWMGPKVFTRDTGRFLKKDHLLKAQAFYVKYGGRAIILARFVPIVRTFAPFVAGIGKMEYRRFFAYNVVGGIAWINIFLFLGLFFGTIPWVKENMETVVIAIVIISVLPIIWEIIAAKLEKKKAGAAGFEAAEG